MKTSTRSTFLPGAFALTLLLSACGGGGGGDGTSAGTTDTPVGSGGSSTPATTSAITQTNYQAVASTAVAPIDGLVSASDATGMMVGGVEVNASAGSLASTSLDLYKRFRAQAPQLATGVVFSEACSGGGSVTVDESIASEDRYTVGDRATITANNCKESGMPTLNGVLRLSVASVSGDPINSNLYSLGFATTFENFAIVDSGESITINGDMNVTASQNGSSTLSLAFSGQRLAYTIGGSGTATRSYQVSSYAFNSTETAGVVSLTGGYTVSGSATSLGGNYSYTMEIVQPLRMSSSSAYPSSGKVIVRGSPATVTVTVLSTSSVKLDFSASGNDVITSSNTLGWSAFEALN